MTPDAVLPCWCGSRDLQRCWRRRTFGLLRCTVCGTYRIDPPPLTDDADSAAFYNRYYDERQVASRPGEAGRQSRFWKVPQASAESVDGVAIDIGCGDGQLCAELSRSGWRKVIGFDVSRPRVERARQRYPHLRFHDEPIERAGLSAASADLLVMDNVIEHLPDPLRMVRQLGTYLTKTGQLVIITPNMQSGHFALLGRYWTPELAPHAHIYLFTPESLRRLVEQAELHVAAVGTFHEPGAPVSATLMRAARGDLKGALWRAMQDAGVAFGHVIGQGPMLYLVATRREAAAGVDRCRDVVAELHVPGSRESVVRGIPASGSHGARGVSVVVCTYRRPSSLALLLESLRAQTRRPLELHIVDASPDGDARPTRERLQSAHDVADDIHYWQVTGSLRGLTRQRNWALQHVAGDLVLFLDDDVVLEPECVEEMEAVHRSGDRDIVGVGSFSSGQFGPPPPVWRLRRALGIVPSLEPGRYWRSGMSIPWGFARPGRSLLEGDWLPGCAMMWKTAVVRAVGFDAGMDGYAQGEDLDLSLRARRMGRLVMLGHPRLEHRHEPAGRPDPFQLGYMELRNRYFIHRRALNDRSIRDVIWFIYAWTLDTILLARHLLLAPQHATAVLQQIAGRIAAAVELCVTRHATAQR